MGKKTTFCKLTPNKNVDIQIYKESIDFVFDHENNDINNIAISGSYGSGKSSILETYETSHFDKKFIHISLAHFKDDLYIKKENNNLETVKIEDSIDNIKRLEGKILNQLIHQIPDKKIEQTYFNVKKKVTNFDVAKIVIPIIILILSLAHILKFEDWSSFITSLPENYQMKILKFSCKVESKLYSGVALFSMFSYFLWKITYKQKSKSILKKVNIKGNEFEIFSECKDSFFDKYLNEVIYLFKNSDADAIVFEDIDRHDEVQIFERLREINKLINANLNIAFNRKTIKFFYLIKDDIFTSKDRTKFFDYIIPVIPVVDSSNSFDKIIESFDENNINGIKLNEHFLQNISLYIDDMRLLKNICNEFMIYKNRLIDSEVEGIFLIPLFNRAELDLNTMFAMIVYKNIFPKDFADLQLNRGFVYNIINSKENLIKKEKESLKLKIETLDKKIETINSEIAKTKDELEYIFKGRVYSKHNTIITSYFHNKKNYSVENYPNEYEERLAEMENIFSKGRDNYIKELQSEIQEHKNILSDLDDFRIKDILSVIGIDTVFELYKKENKFEYIIKNEYFNLLKYLIREGYLNENSSDYMTYFYGKNICKQDKNFIVSVLNRNAKKWDYKISDLEKVVSRLSIVQFDQYEVLNFDLFEYILENKHKEELNEKLKRLIKQLNTTKNIKFISSFFDEGRETENFIESLNTNWNEFFQISLGDENFSEKQKHDYSILTMYYSSDEDIEQMNKDQCLTNYISNKEDYLNIKEPKLEKIIDIFKLLSISFSKIDSNISNKELLEGIYENNLYVINIDNINMMIDLYYGNFSESEKKQKHYSILSSKIESPILKYINQNISKYFDVMMEYCDKSIIDNEEVAVSLINNEDINLEQKLNYISKLSTEISDISDVNNKELWNNLLKKNILYSGNNVMEFFLNKTNIDENLISFINDNESNLNFKEIDEKYSKENKKSLYDSIIKCNKLKNDKYKNILLDLYVYYEEFNIIDIDDEKLDILINEKIIKMTETSLAFIREQYSSNVNYYISKNIKKYSEIMTSNIFEFEEFMLLLEDNNIPVDILLNLLDFTSEQISVIDKCYPDQIISKILTTNLNKDDIKYLFEKYETYSHEIKLKILEISQGRIIQIQNGEFNLSYAMIKDMLQNKDLQILQKINLLESYVNSRNISEFLELLKIAKLEELNEVEELLRSNENIQEISANSTNERFLEALEKNKIIYEYKTIKTEENEIIKEYYEVIKKSPNEVV